MDRTSTTNDATPGDPLPLPFRQLLLNYSNRSSLSTSCHRCQRMAGEWIKGKASVAAVDVAAESEYRRAFVQKANGPSFRFFPRWRQTYDDARSAFDCTIVVYLAGNNGVILFYLHNPARTGRKKYDGGISPLLRHPGAGKGGGPKNVFVWKGAPGLKWDERRTRTGCTGTETEPKMTARS